MHACPIHNLEHFPLYIRCHNHNSIHLYTTITLSYAPSFDPQNNSVMKAGNIFLASLYTWENWDLENLHHVLKDPYRAMAKPNLKHRPSDSKSSASFVIVIYCQLQDGFNIVSLKHFYAYPVYWSL